MIGELTQLAHGLGRTTLEGPFWTNNPRLEPVLTTSAQNTNPKRQTNKTVGRTWTRAGLKFYVPGCNIVSAVRSILLHTYSPTLSQKDVFCHRKTHIFCALASFLLPSTPHLLCKHLHENVHRAVAKCDFFYRSRSRCMQKTRISARNLHSETKTSGFKHILLLFNRMSSTHTQRILSKAPFAVLGVYGG